MNSHDTPEKNEYKTKCGNRGYIEIRGVRITEPNPTPSHATKSLEYLWTAVCSPEENAAHIKADWYLPKSQQLDEQTNHKEALSKAAPRPVTYQSCGAYKGKTVVS